MTTETLFGTATIDTLAIAVLQHNMRGELLQPSHEAYDTARLLVNSRFNSRPALIARCHCTEDVAHAVAFAREYDLEIAVRSGGHSTAGHSVGNDGMKIDLSQMREIVIDAEQRTARVQPGATNSDLVMAAAGYGLATTTGTCATVGMGGSTLGGGIGWLMGRFGMTIDNVLAFEMVTADGDIVTASADENTDLFWALRGGGGNFGVVTTITYQLHELGTVLGGVVIFPIAMAPLALRTYREMMSSAPDELVAHAVMTSIPDFGPALIVQACYSGADLSEGERVLAPMRGLGAPIDAIAPRPYAELYMMLTPPIPPRAGFYDTAYTLRELSDAAFDEMIACLNDSPSPFSIIEIHPIHGAATRVAADATAFALRESHYAVTNIGMWVEGTGAEETTWSRQTHTRMAPFASRGLYVNFLGEEGEQAVRDTYRANYERLAAIKAHYDPENIFHRNQNIRPANDR